MSQELQDRAERFLINEIKFQSAAIHPDEIGCMGAIAALLALDLITDRQADLFRSHLYTAVSNRRDELRKAAHEVILDKFKVGVK